MKKFFAILSARNKEFFRDKSALSWNFAFPVLLIFGFAFMFSDEGSKLYKIGIYQQSINEIKQATRPPSELAFKNLKHISFVDYENLEKAILKVDQHKIDLLVDFEHKKYWVNQTSSKGYIVEQLLLAQLPDMTRQETDGRAVRYVDWVMPGILGMNMMFSCLFGVGYVIVRYRKNGVLKRFQATPLTAFEFLTAQVISRLLIVLLVTTLLFVGCNLFINFYVLGSYFNLLIIAMLGSTSMIAMSLLIASRSSSEELTGGLLNFASWPMMLLSGVWFSLEGAHPVVQKIAQIFPLTHILEAARAVMTDGAGLMEIKDNLLVLLVMTIIFLFLGSKLFNWGSERT
ncbi:ABC transporter permease [Aliikangiella sp. G2MR2-5]|uniref:ABC transporter permease n=1 Tax=Aliikangiella sp. G2MR2-5 TaxID=2788943 RepID=UPI0018AB76B4|nr:ABC transporter permease [Aliikangiella sp. G2MR2-5]